MELAIKLVLGICFSVYVGGALWIRQSRRLGFIECIRLDGPERHITSKKNTVTGGGIFVVPSLVCIAALLVPTPYLLVGALGMLACGVIGAIDDYHKLSKQSNPDRRGLSMRSKLILQLLLCTVLSGVLVTLPGWDFAISLGSVTLFQVPRVLYVILVSLYLVLVVNCVNLTDGLDGLATGAAMPQIFGVLLLTLMIGGLSAARTEAVVVLSLAISLAYGVFLLAFNRHPAKVFMGDTGSLALGFGVAILPILAGQEILGALLSIVFIVNGLSSLFQILYFKYTKYKTGEGKRILRMAPLHHHYEKLGYGEVQIVRAYWLVAMLVSVVVVGGLWLIRSCIA